MSASLSVLDDLIALIDARKRAREDESYTKSLLVAGTERCAKKLGEEAFELVIASLTGNDRDITHEAADVVYHLLVLLAARNIKFEDVLAELKRRTAQSGLAEKAARG